MNERKNGSSLVLRRHFRFFTGIIFLLLLLKVSYAVVS